MIRLLIIPVVLFFCQSAALGESLILAAGAGYKRPVSQIIQAFEKSGGGQIDQIYGNVAQITMQARGEEKVGILVADRSCFKSSGLEFASFHDLGEGVLVIAYRKKIKLRKPSDLLKPEIGRIAIPDERFAIYGRAGKEFLQNTGILDRVKKKLLVVATVPQVSSYLISGDVDAGFINLTDAVYIRDKIGGYITPDKAGYGPIKIILGVIKGHENSAKVIKFLSFVDTSPVVKQMLKKAGLQTDK
jgi:molybdate transport system substrate-binding protein